jgi:acetolactate decarboxylase
MYQVSTLQALAMGYTRQVVTVEELLKHGDTGLGTFEGVDGEMILLDGVCYKANDDGSVEVAPPDMGVPFSAVTFLKGKHQYEIKEISEIEELKTLLDLKIEKHFGLNSMHIAKVDGRFSKVRARAGSAYHSHHVSLKEILSKTQKE